MINVMLIIKTLKLNKMLINALANNKSKEIV